MMAPVRTPELDEWLPDPAIRTRHRRTAPVAAEALWEAASGVRVGDTRGLGHAVRWRLPGTTADTTYRELFARPPFTVLGEGEEWSVSGLVGRIWTLQRDYPRLDGPDAFRDWAERDTARVLFAHWVEPADNGDSALVSEARVEPVGTRAAVRLRALWAVVGPFERLIGGEALSLAVRRAR
jgi:hypothetical protein